MKISVDSLKPFSRTSAIRSNSSPPRARARRPAGSPAPRRPRRAPRRARRCSRRARSSRRRGTARRRSGSRSAAGGRPAWSRWKPTAHSVSAAGSDPTIITSSPIVLITRASSGSVPSTASTNRSTASTASSSPSSSVSRVYPVRSANAIATRIRPRSTRVALEVGLHVADDVLLDEVLQVALVDLVHHGRGQRQQLAREREHLLGGLDAGGARAHQRLVHVQVEQPHLGVGDPRHRLPVDPHQLQQRDQRKAGLEHRAPRSVGAARPMPIGARPAPG